MDLTKIVLPTFILERRSLLEMYADFFAHPDIFVEIQEKTTPEERMVQVMFQREGGDKKQNTVIDCHEILNVSFCNFLMAIESHF